VTPNRPDATCFIADRFESPLAIGKNLSGSSPPSPVLDLPPMRFMAMANASWLSAEIDPKLIAPVLNRLTISEAGSTLSRGTGELTPVRNSRRPLKVALRVVTSLACLEKARYASQFRVLSCDAHRACIEVALTHHDAAESDQWCSGESEIFSPK